MMLTPKEVRAAKLTTHRFLEGYDTDETDELLDDCACTIQVLTEELAGLITQTRPMRPAAAPIRSKLTTE